ncbi:MAG: hypothetical protein HY982_01945 [Candidatus Magasanikbacteria bacterium]|nr:hypothetical protein [Candidatus Magasanikbacteria bacterium]
MRDSSWKFRQGDTAAPEAELARAQMRKEELKRVEGKKETKKRPTPQFAGKETEELKDHYKRQEINWPEKVTERYRSAAEVEKPGVHEELADEIDANLGKPSQEERRRVEKMERESRAPHGPLKRFVEEDKTWVQIRKGERPVQKPKYKTEPEELHPPRQKEQGRSKGYVGQEDQERKAA